jgi:hypothetical protein
MPLALVKYKSVHEHVHVANGEWRSDAAASDLQPPRTAESAGFHAHAGQGELSASSKSGDFGRFEGLQQSRECTFPLTRSSGVGIRRAEMIARFNNGLCNGVVSPMTPYSCDIEVWRMTRIKQAAHASWAQKSGFMAGGNSVWIRVRLKNAVESDGFSGRLGRLQSLFPGSVLPE